KGAALCNRRMSGHPGLDHLKRWIPAFAEMTTRMEASFREGLGNSALFRHASESGRRFATDECPVIQLFADSITRSAGFPRSWHDRTRPQPGWPADAAGRVLRRCVGPATGPAADRAATARGGSCAAGRAAGPPVRF